MEISITRSGDGRNPIYQTQEEEIILLQKKMDADEWIVRKELVKAWTKILDKYARPGVHIPSVKDIRRELLEAGVDAAVEKVVDAHWCVWSFMIRDKIERKVRHGLEKFDLAGFVSDVKMAQDNPGKKVSLRAMIEHYVLYEDF